MLASGGNTNFLGSSPNGPHENRRPPGEGRADRAVCAQAPRRWRSSLDRLGRRLQRPPAASSSNDWRKNPRISRAHLRSVGPCGRNADVISGTNCCPLDITMRARSMSVSGAELGHDISAVALDRARTVFQHSVPLLPCSMRPSSASVGAGGLALRQRATAGKPCRPESPYCLPVERRRVQAPMISRTRSQMAPRDRTASR